MWTTWGDFDRTLAVMDELRRRMERAFDDVDMRGTASAGALRVNLYDAGEAFVLEADLPGFQASSLDVTANQDGLSVTGERREQPPEGYSVHRQERAATRFSRSFTFPCRIDPEQVQATLRDGVLQLRVGKAADARPRRISVKAG